MHLGRNIVAPASLMLFINIFRRVKGVEMIAMGPPYFSDK
jgi:hypothetical protein